MIGVVVMSLFRNRKAVTSLRHNLFSRDDDVLAPGNHKSQWGFEIVVSPESNIPSILDVVSMMVLAYAISMLHNFLP